MVTTQSFQTHWRGLRWDLFWWPYSKAWHLFSLWLWPGDVTPRRCEAKWRPLLVRPERSRSLFTGARHGAGARFQRHQAPGDWPLLIRRRRTRATEQTHFFSDYSQNTLGVWYFSLESEGLMIDLWWIYTNSKNTCSCFGTDYDPISFFTFNNFYSIKLKYVSLAGGRMLCWTGSN